LFLDIHATSKCNLRCKHCYLSNDYKDKEIIMPFEMLKKITDEFMSIHPKMRKTYLLSGGEVTTYPYINKIIKYVHEKYKKGVTIASNGYKVKSLLAENVLGKKDRVQLSLDGDEIMHNWLRGNNYKTVIRALEALKSEEVQHTIHMTVHSLNAHTIPHVIKIAKKYEVLNLSINYYHDNGNKLLNQLSVEDFLHADKFVNEHYESIGEKRCYLNKCVAGAAGMSVLPDGTYWDCSRNQKVIGKYPESIETVMKKSEKKSPDQTCMKTKKEEVLVYE